MKYIYTHLLCFFGMGNILFIVNNISISVIGERFNKYSPINW